MINGAGLSCEVMWGHCSPLPPPDELNTLHDRLYGKTTGAGMNSIKYSCDHSINQKYRSSISVNVKANEDNKMQYYGYYGVTVNMLTNS